MNSNPSGCCGTQTSCCEGVVVPDRLTATVMSDCETVTTPMVFNGAGWRGQVTILCRHEEGGPCVSESFDFELRCDSEGWFLDACGADWGVIANCETPMFDAGAQCLCHEPIQFTITE